MTKALWGRAVRPVSSPLQMNISRRNSSLPDADKQTSRQLDRRKGLEQPGEDKTLTAEINTSKMEDGEGTRGPLFPCNVSRGASWPLIVRQIQVLEKTRDGKCCHVRPSEDSTSNANGCRPKETFFQRTSESYQ